MTDSSKLLSNYSETLPENWRLCYVKANETIGLELYSIVHFCWCSELSISEYKGPMKAAEGCQTLPGIKLGLMMCTSND